ncbi:MULTISPECIES: flagellar basal body rod protein FlgG [Bacillaceae]|uniref:flagellar basal body rod protein FlgG n=1 Tax=Bacillaceae TaxID=186817 RepID=UPI0006FEA05D|nr:MULTISPECIES: flagellar basal body rod protein FlgG [Bacillaceae]KQL35520.1 flagellar basal-body rod protein FlgG [Psychrobacillus sp. FJAT-21963]MDF2066019.1 flagellar basal body rod protein FlgG [Bacillus sp. Cr_A10]
MIRSMYSGISGLKNFQTKLDVIGNNISNVNTYGFKKGRTVFKDLISQTTSGASGASANRGGVNPKQVGLGSQLASIDTIHSGGSLQSTGNTLDLAMSGDGFFIVADSAATPTPGTDVALQNLQYTRAGNFYMDANGYLVNGDGKYVYGFSENAEDIDTTGTAAGPGVDPGYAINPDGTIGTGTIGPIRIPTNAKSMSISQDGTVTFVDAFNELQYAGKLVNAKFPNAGGLEKSGNNYYTPSSNSGDPLFSFATQNGIGSVNSGFLEMSNVDLSEEFTDMIVAQRGFQANTRIITTSDQILEELVNLKR